MSRSSSRPARAAPRPGARTPLTWVAATLVALLVALGPGTTVPAEGQTRFAGQPAEETVEEAVSLRLDEVTPGVAVPGEDLRLRGRIVNQGGMAMRYSSLTAAVSPTPLTSRAEIASWLAGEPIRGSTTVIGDDAVGPVVGGGSQGSFDITVPPSVTDSFPEGPSVLALTLSATSEDDDRGRGGDQVVLRTVLTSGGASEVAHPLDVSWLVPLTLPPDPDLTSADPDDHAEAWVAATGPDSAIIDWLDHLTVPEITYVVDPATLVPHRPAPGIATPASGSTDAEAPEDGTEDDAGDRGGDQGGEQGGDQGVAATAAPAPGDSDPGGTAPPPDDTTPTDQPPEPEPAPDDPEDVLAHQFVLRSALDAVDPDRLWWLPTDDPDLEVLLDRSPPDAATLLASDPLDPPPAVSRLLAAGRADLAWPIAAGTSAQDLTALSDLYADRDGAPLSVALLPREAFTADSSAGPGRGAMPLAEPGGVTALGIDSWASALVADSDHDAAQHGTGAAAQHLLAHTLGMYQENPDQPRELVIAPPRGAPVDPQVMEHLSRGWEQAPWLTSVSAQTLLERARGSEPLVATPTVPQDEVLGPLVDLLDPGPSPVTDTRAAAVARMNEQTASLSQVLADTDPLRSWEPVRDGLWSSRWRGHEGAWTEVFARLRQDVDAAGAGVHVTPSTVNFITDQGAINVTVVNELGVAVQDVTLELAANNGRLQVTRQPDPFSIGPGSRASVSFDARAITRGETTLTARISTPDGTVLGSEAAIDVRIQPTGLWIYWVMGGLAAVVLVLGVSRALRSEPRVAAPAAGTADEPSTSGTPADRAPHPDQETDS